ncbi:MAG TPA: hypothetical protein VI981_03755 [Candidatus Paceibacterota bacterium]
MTRENTRQNETVFGISFVFGRPLRIGAGKDTYSRRQESRSALAVSEVKSPRVSGPTTRKSEMDRSIRINPVIRQTTKRQRETSRTIILCIAGEYSCTKRQKNKKKREPCGAVRALAGFGWRHYRV